jgi:hypothetical protein
MVHAELASGAGDSGFVTDKDDLDVVPQARPALERVALNIPDVADEWLRDGEDRQHAGHDTAAA